MVRAANGAAAAPLAQTLASFFQDDGLLLRKFVYRVEPRRGAQEDRAGGERIVAPPRAGIELRIFAWFVLPLLLILVALLGLLVRSFPGPRGPRDPRARDRPARPRGRRPLHRAPDGTWSAQGLSLASRRSQAAATFTLQAAGPRALRDGLDPAGLDPRDAALLPLDLDEVRRALEAATDAGTREDKIHALNLDYAARSLRRRGGGADPHPLARRARPTRRRRLRPGEGAPRLQRRPASPAPRAARAGGHLREGRGSPRPRGGTARCASAATASSCARSPAAAARTRGSCCTTTACPRSSGSRRPARPLPARLPLPAQPPAGRELTRHGEPHPRRGDRRARAAARGALPPARPGARARDAVGEGARSTPWPATGRPSSSSGPRLPDAPLPEVIRAHPRGRPAGRRVSILARDPRLGAGGDGGGRARGGRQRGAAPAARPLRARELGGQAPRRARGACSRGFPCTCRWWAARAERAGRALLRPQPQPQRPRHAAREPGADRGRGPRPRDRPPRARGARPRAGPDRARGPGGGLALHRLRGRVPLPARGRAATRSTAWCGARPRPSRRRACGPRGRSTRPCGATSGSTRSRSRRARRAASWWRSAAAAREGWRPGHGEPLLRGAGRVCRRAPSTRPARSCSRHG